MKSVQTRSACNHPEIQTSQFASSCGTCRLFLSLSLVTALSAASLYGKVEMTFTN